MIGPPQMATWQQLQPLVQRLQRLRTETLRVQFAVVASLEANTDTATLEAQLRELQSNAESVIGTLKELGAKLV